MNDLYTITATIISLGEMTQVYYQKDGANKVFTKFEFECQVDDTVRTLESPGWNQGKLEVGKTYELEVELKDGFTDSVRRIIGDKGTAPAPKPVEPLKPTAQPAEPTKSPDKPPTAKGLKPDYPARWREWNTHARTAQMQATERVKLYVNLALEGKLQNDQGEIVQALRKSTIEQWVSEEITRYWTELAIESPKDAHGDLVGGE